MHQVESSTDLLKKLKGKTAIITGSAGGIGAATATLFNRHGCNVIITDLPSLRHQAEDLIKSLEYSASAIFVAASVTEWRDLVVAYREGIQKFGMIDIVVANAGIMESRMVLDVEEDASGNPIESREGHKVIDVNLKGTLNTLRLGIHYMRNNYPDEDGRRGSIVLIASTSGYFGSTGNVAYVASKHGVVGLLRASQQMVGPLQISVNAIAPSFTPTYITAGFGESVSKAGIEHNTPEMVGLSIAYAALDSTRQGTCCLVAGKFQRELELTQMETIAQWLGSDLVDMLAAFGNVLKETGGYPLPAERL